MTEEAPITVTLKSGTAYDAAWMVIRGDNPVDIQGKLEAIANNGVGAVVASADQAFKAAFTVGAGLGATPVAAPRNPEPQAPAQQSNPWAVTDTQQAVGQQAPTGSNPWGQSQQAAPAPTNTFGGPQDGGDAGAPLVLGMPARRVSGAKGNRQWAAWADPRPKEATNHIQEKTDDPNDPRLAQGTAKFWAFIRD